MRPVKIAAAVALATAIVAVRIWHLDADPPAWLSWSTGIFTDEGYYGGDAREAVRHGHWLPGDFHSALLSPTLYWAQLATFRLFGTGMVAGRAISVAFGALTVLLLFVLLKRLYNERTAWAGAVILGFSAPFVMYNRLALMETPAAALMTGAMLALTYAGDTAGQRPRRISAAAGALMGWALVTKLLAAPAAAGPLIWAYRKLGSRAAPMFAAAAVGPLIAVAALWTLPYAAHLRAMGAYYIGHQMMPHSFGALMQNWYRALWTGHRDGLLPTLLRLDVPLTALGAVGACVALKRRTDGDIALLGWLLPLMVVLACSSYTPTRYDVLFLPALAGLAARLFVNAPPKVIGAICAALLLIESAGMSKALSHSNYTIRDSGASIGALVPADARLYGQTGPELCMDAPCTGIIVQPGLANDAGPASLPGYVAVTRTPYWTAWWTRNDPQEIIPANRVGTVRLGPGMIVDIYCVVS